LKLNKVNLIFRTSYVLFKTLKVERVFLSQPEFPSIVAFWHGRMFLLPFALKDYAERVSILISRHRDGELVARLVEKLGFKTVRGSTGAGKGGERAFFEMMTWLKRGGVVAITPDGPRGPREKVKPGIAKLAFKAKVPVYPLTFSANRGINLNSWDRFLIPLPFSKCKVVLGEPIYPENFKSEEEMRKEVELRLKELTFKADKGEV
jgi:lysophospholipid acyltransferase (LPLAT)-like uncharacterized protein